MIDSWNFSSQFTTTTSFFYEKSVFGKKPFNNLLNLKNSDKLLNIYKLIYGSIIKKLSYKKIPRRRLTAYINISLETVKL